MKEQIELELGVLIGRPMWGSARAADMEMFGFGGRVVASDFRGRPVEKGEYALHIQCPWRLASSGRILVGSSDLYYPRGDPVRGLPDFEWEKPGVNRRDELLERFFGECEKSPAIVRGLSADDVGGFRLSLSGDCVLEVFPNDSLDIEGHSERWRFLQPGTDIPHLVVTGRGTERV